MSAGCFAAVVNAGGAVLQGMQPTAGNLATCASVGLVGGGVVGTLIGLYAGSFYLLGLPADTATQLALIPGVCSFFLLKRAIEDVRR